jgi:hypothetical protein
MRNWDASPVRRVALMQAPRATPRRAPIETLQHPLQLTLPSIINTIAIEASIVWFASRIASSNAYDANSDTISFSHSSSDS